MALRYCFCTRFIFVIFCSQTEETFHKEGYFQFKRHCQNKLSFKISKLRKEILLLTKQTMSKQQQNLLFLITPETFVYTNTHTRTNQEKENKRGDFDRSYFGNKLHKRKNDFTTIRVSPTLHAHQFIGQSRDTRKGIFFRYTLINLQDNAATPQGTFFLYYWRPAQQSIQCYCSSYLCIVCPV